MFSIFTPFNNGFKTFFKNDLDPELNNHSNFFNYKFLYFFSLKRVLI